MAESILLGDDWGKKICAYADNRVSPYSVVSVERHSLDAIERYKGHSHEFSEESRRFFVKNIKEIEKQIFSHSNIKPEDINDDSIKSYLEKLKNFDF